MTNYVILSLEKLGDGIDSIPGTSKTSTSPGIRDPSNIATGVARGTKSLLTKVFGAVAGMIVEPLKGAKQGGLKGGAVGFGKGMLGLVCKPVKGTIDLVTQTTRGISNTPKTMYVGLNRMMKRVPKSKSKIDGPLDPVNDQYLCEQDGQAVYINKKLLKAQIYHSELLSTLLY
jgi:hypothetical protein